MTDLPSGTVTILFTDLESSTRLWEEHGDSMPDALARHDEIMRATIDACGGHVVKTTGDGVHAVFARASDALSAAKAAQLAVEGEPWAITGGLRVRIGIHTTEAALRDGDYFGSGVNRAARLMAIAHGGQIVCSQTTADLVRDQLEDCLTLVDLGEHRLRDLSRAERVFQLTGPGLTSEFPPLHSLDAYPTNLPAQLSTFIGREIEVAAVADALRDARLVTLTGVGGVGKTRLALQAAGEMVQEFAGGAWVVELGGLADALALPETVASAMRIAPPPGTSIVDALTAALREQPTLMMLDNCEHLLEGVAQFVGEMLRAAPDLRVLCTSREGLGLRGERIVAVQPLAVPAEGGTDASTTDAVRLFVERAHASARRSRSATTTLKRSSESVAESTASRWPSSWRPRASGRWRRARSRRASTSDSSCCQAARAAPSTATKRFAAQSTGRTTCCLPRRRGCSSACRSASGGSTSRPRKRLA
jgi:class 3 adenylate cyclase